MNILYIQTLKFNQYSIFLRSRNFWNIKIDWFSRLFEFSRIFNISRILEHFRIFKFFKFLKFCWCSNRSGSVCNYMSCLCSCFDSLTSVLTRNLIKFCVVLAREEASPLYFVHYHSCTLLLHCSDIFLDVDMSDGKYIFTCWLNSALAWPLKIECTYVIRTSVKV